MPKSANTEMVNVRLPTADMDALRLICQVTGRPMAEEIRSAVREHLSSLRKDAALKTLVLERVEEMRTLYSALDAGLPDDADPDPDDELDAFATDLHEGDASPEDASADSANSTA